MKTFSILIILVFLLVGCVTTTEQYQSYTDAYKVYAKMATAGTQNKACEIKTDKDVTIPAGLSITCYQGGGQYALRPPEQVDHSASARMFGRVLSLGVQAVLGWKAFDSLENVLVKGFDSAGHNTTQTWGDYSGNGADGYHLTDNSIHDSYNPVTTDSHDDNSVRDSHDQNWTDNHSGGAP